MLLADDRSAFHLGDIKQTLATITPSDLQPWLDISQDYVTLNSSGAGSWPLLVPFLRGLSGGAGYVVTGYTPGVTTVLQMDSTDSATKAFVIALTEDNLFHGDNTANYLNYKTITVSSPFGIDLVAGDYAIVNINPIAYTIEIDVTTAGPGIAGTVDHYPFRISGSTTTARWFRITDASLTTPGGNYGAIPFFRFRDRIHSHYHPDAGHLHAHQEQGAFVSSFSYAINMAGAIFPTIGAREYGSVVVGSADIRDPSNSLTAGVEAIRQGANTRGRQAAVRHYLYGEVYQP